jgi:hypothetical protein
LAQWDVENPAKRFIAAKDAYGFAHYQALEHEGLGHPATVDGERYRTLTAGLRMSRNSFDVDDVVLHAVAPEITVRRVQLGEAVLAVHDVVMLMAMPAGFRAGRKARRT